MCIDKSKCLGGGEIDGQLEFRRLMHRQIGRPLAARDTIDVRGCTPIPIGQIEPVRDQAIDLSRIRPRPPEAASILRDL